MKRKLTKPVFSFFTVLAVITTCNNVLALDAPMLAVSTSGINVSVSWTKVSDGESWNLGSTKYTLYYAPSPYNGPDTIGHIEMGYGTRFSTTLWNGASYLVAIIASNNRSESGYSNIETISIDNSAQIDKYVDNGDGTISDSESGLMWQSLDSESSMPYSESYGDYCNDLTVGGYEDWVLPSKNTLNELVYCSNGTKTPLADGETCGENGSYVIPTIDPVFSSLYFYTGNYWSSTSDGSSKEWVVNFSSGVSSTLSTRHYSHARCVRGELCNSDNLEGCQYASGEAVATVLFSLQSFEQQLLLLQGLTNTGQMESVISTIDDLSKGQKIITIINHEPQIPSQIIMAIYTGLSSTDVPDEVLNAVILSNPLLAWVYGNVDDGTIGLMLTDLALSNKTSNDPKYQELYQIWNTYTSGSVNNSCAEITSSNYQNCSQQ